MRRSAVLAMAALCVGLLGACDDKDEDPIGLAACTGLSGNYVASTFTATGTTDNTLLHNFLTGGGAFSINFTPSTFSSSYVAQTGATPLTRSSVYSETDGNITLGSQTLFEGAANGNQVFTCTKSGNTITLRSPTTTYIFAGSPTPKPARFNITLTKAS